jgi:hypothetical protein
MGDGAGDGQDIPKWKIMIPKLIFQSVPEILN